MYRSKRGGRWRAVLAWALGALAVMLTGGCGRGDAISSGGVSSASIGSSTTGLSRPIERATTTAVGSTVRATASPPKSMTTPSALSSPGTSLPIPVDVATPPVTAADSKAPSSASPFGESFELAPVPAGVPGRPAWLGTRPLRRAANGYGEVSPTPTELEGRAFPTVDRLPQPFDGAFHADIREVPTVVVARSTWTAECPVALDELRYVRVSYWGFDMQVHTGEMLIQRRAAEDVADVFRQLFEAQFPLEGLLVADQSVLDETIPPTGDGNGSGALVCRPARGTARWSDHALGLAIDLNPFQNPYKKGGAVLPELASSYLDRADVRPGMITTDGPVVAAFRSIGWGWGGTWNSSKDYMHFSESGR